MASHPKRLPGFSYVGKYHYFFTFCTAARRNVFVDAEAFELLRTQLLLSSMSFDVAIHAYCAMPDHVHLLAQGLSDGSDAKRFIAHFKQRTGWRYRDQYGGRLWQGSFFDHVLRPEEGTASVIAYIVKNTTEAGLAAKPEDYPFWGSFTRTSQEVIELVSGAAIWTPPKLGHNSGQPIKG